MTLDQCLEAGEKNNPGLMASTFRLEAVGNEVKAARADFLPSLSTGYSMSRIGSISSKGLTDTDYLDQDTRNFNVRVTQILYAGSRVLKTYQRQKLAEQVSMADLELAQLELAYNIKTTFYRLMKARQDLKIAEESISRLAQSLESAQAFFSRDLVPYVDVLQAKVDLEAAKEKKSIAQNTVNRQRITLFTLMNLPAEPGVAFDGEIALGDMVDPEFKACRDAAFEKRPDIKSLEYQLAVVRKDAEIALGRYLPTVQAEVGYYDQDRDYVDPGISYGTEYDRDQRNRYWSVGVSVSWELFDGGRSWYARAKYQSDADRVAAMLQETKNLISERIKGALFSMAEAKNRIHTSQETLSAAEEYYQREERRLHAGISTVKALLDSQERLVRAQGSRSVADLDYQLAKSELMFMLGEKKHENG